MPTDSKPWTWRKKIAQVRQSGIKLYGKVLYYEIGKVLEQAAQAVEALSVEMVKARLDGDLGSLVQY